jgi:hypothetical protein
MAKETYCLEIINNITRTVVTDLKLLDDVHYTAKGLTALVEDQYNMQKYKINITPIREGEIE